MKKGLCRAGIATLVIAAGNILAWLLNMAAGGGSLWGLFLSGGGYVREWGEASFRAVVRRNQWWRLLTCGYLHVGVFHLIFNLYALLLIGSKAEKCIGAVSFCFFYHFSIIITVFLWCSLFQDGSMVGASSGIFAVLGAYAALRKPGRFRSSLPPLSAGQKRYLVLYTLAGCLLGIETIAVHGIGFVVGALLAVLGRRLLPAKLDVI